MERGEVRACDAAIGTVVVSARAGGAFIAEGRFTASLGSRMFIAEAAAGKRGASVWVKCGALAGCVTHRVRCKWSGYSGCGEVAG